MCAIGEETLQPGFGLRRRIRLGDTDRVEAARDGALDQRSLDFNRVS
jgi:hypothetical protein